MTIDPSRQFDPRPGDLGPQEEFFDAMLRHQIGILRVIGSISNEVTELLDSTEADVRAQIEEAARIGTGIGLVGPTRVRRLNRLVENLRETRSGAFRQVRETWLSSITDIARREPQFVDRALKTTMLVDINSELPSARRLAAIVREEAFEGRTLRQWARSIERSDIERIESQIKIGLTQGETIPQISRRIVGTVSQRGRNGVTAVTRRAAQGITRTVANGVANRARQEYHVENSHLISSELYVATLDSRTTPVCAANDGKQFPIGIGPMPPLHFNCRSLRVALVDAEALGRRPSRPTTQRGLLREFTRQQGIRPVTRRADLPRGFKGRFDAFSRRRIREMSQIVPAKTSYQEFLSRQSAEFQNDYLGRTRARLFRGGVRLDRFVNPEGRPLTLSELAEREVDAFRAAGLDPNDFL